MGKGTHKTAEGRMGVQRKEADDRQQRRVDATRPLPCVGGPARTGSVARVADRGEAPAGFKDSERRPLPRGCGGGSGGSSRLRVGHAPPCACATSSSGRSPVVTQAHGRRWAGGRVGGWAGGGVGPSAGRRRRDAAVGRTPPLPSPGKSSWHTLRKGGASIVTRPGRIDASHCRAAGPAHTAYDASRTFGGSSLRGLGGGGGGGGVAGQRSPSDGPPQPQAAAAAA